MPFFGASKDEENAKLHAELQRISALPLPQLASEVMRKGFGPDALGADGAAVKIQDLAGVFNPAQGSFGIDDDALRDMYNVVSEGVQVLEHACLLRLVMSTEPRGSVLYQWALATRLGQDTLQLGSVERVLASGAP
jgi:hypothetical protein